MSSAFDRACHPVPVLDLSRGTPRIDHRLAAFLVLPLAFVPVRDPDQCLCLKQNINRPRWMMGGEDRLSVEFEFVVKQRNAE